MTFRGCDIVQECPLEARTRERDGDGCDRLSLAWTVPRYTRRPIPNICKHFSFGSKCKKDKYAMIMIMMRMMRIDVDVSLSTYYVCIFTIPVKSGWLCTIRFLHYSSKESFFCAIQIFWAKFPPSILYIYIERETIYVI